MLLILEQIPGIFNFFFQPEIYLIFLKKTIINLFAYLFIFIHLVGIYNLQTTKGTDLKCSIWWVLTFVNTHETTSPKQKQKNVFITPESFFMLLIVDFTPLPNTTMFWLLSYMVFVIAFVVVVVALHIHWLK